MKLLISLNYKDEVHNRQLALQWMLMDTLPLNKLYAAGSKQQDIMFVDRGKLYIMNRNVQSNIKKIPRCSFYVSPNTILSRVLLFEAHNKSFHDASQTIIAKLRVGLIKNMPSVHIPQAERALRVLEKDCVICKARTFQSVIQHMGNAESNVTEMGDPFTDIMIDSLGPILLKTHPESKQFLKYNVFIAVCKHTKLLYTDIISGATSAHYLLAIQRLKSHYNQIQSISMDPATAFMPFTAAFHEHEAWNDLEVKERYLEGCMTQLRMYCHNEDFRVKISSPKSSWKQGAVEISVGQIKAALASAWTFSVRGNMTLYKCDNLEVDQFRSLLQDITRSLNGRPYILSVKPDGPLSYISRQDLLGLRHTANETVHDRSYNIDKNKKLPKVIAKSLDEVHKEYFKAMEIITQYILYSSIQLSDFRAASQELGINDICLVIDRVKETKNLEIYKIVEIKVDTDRQSTEVILCRIEAARVTNQQPLIHPFPITKNTTEPHFLTRDPKNLVLLIKADSHENNFIFFDFNYPRETFEPTTSKDNLTLDFRVKNQEAYIQLDDLPDSEKYIELPDYLKDLPKLVDRDYPGVDPDRKERLKRLETIKEDRKLKRKLLEEKQKLQLENAKLKLTAEKTRNRKLLLAQGKNKRNTRNDSNEQHNITEPTEESQDDNEEEIQEDFKDLFETEEILDENPTLTQPAFEPLPQVDNLRPRRIRRSTKKDDYIYD